MEEFLKEASNPSWWLGVVVVGILINMLSGYIQKRLDTVFSNLSSWWRNRSEAKKIQRIEDIQFLHDNPSEQILVALSEIRYYFRGIVYFLFSLFFQIMYVVAKNNDPKDPSLVISTTTAERLLLFSATLLMFIGTRNFLAATEKQRLLKEARKKI